MQKAAEAIKAVTPDCFDGDAYMLLASVYKNQQIPLPIRLKAAETAIGYERPKLAAIEHSGDEDKPIGIVITSGVPRMEDEDDTDSRATAN
jgi:hypothetical protein